MGLYFTRNHLGFAPARRSGLFVSGRSVSGRIVDDFAGRLRRVQVVRVCIEGARGFGCSEGENLPAIFYNDFVLVPMAVFLGIFLASFVCLVG